MGFFMVGICLVCVAVLPTPAASDEPAYVEAARIISELITENSRFFLGPHADSISDKKFVEIVNFLTGFTMEDSSSLEPVLQALQESTGLVGAFDALHETGVLRSAFDSVYRFFCSVLPMDRENYRSYVTYYGEDCDVTEVNCQYEKQSEAFVKLGDLLESTGFCSVDVNGVRKFWDYVTADITGMHWQDDATTEAILKYFKNLPNNVIATTEQETEKDCAEINAASEDAWTWSIEIGEKWNPNYEEEMKDAVRGWTGIYMKFGTTHAIEDYVCYIMENIRGVQMEKLFDSFVQSAIAYNAFMESYPWFKREVETWEWVTRVNTEAIEGGDTSYPEGAYEGHKRLQRLLQLVREMGLMDLKGVWGTI